MEEDFEAHRADQDTEATYRVLQGELDMYNPETQEEEERRLPNDMNTLNEFSKLNDNVDFSGRIVWQNVVDAEGHEVKDADGNPQRIEVFNFGKYKGQPVAYVLQRDPGYYNWIMTSDFTLNTKQILTRIKLQGFNR
jgi:DNA polymerase-3 subunit epsilon